MESSVPRGTKSQRLSKALGVRDRMLYPDWAYWLMAAVLVLFVCR